MRAMCCWFAAAALFAAATGCEPAAPTLATVRGKVSFKGVLLHTGSIVFTPDSVRGMGGSHARADIQPDGTYELRTGELRGAAPGWHRVTILAVDVPPPLPSGEPSGIPRSLLPARFGDPELSGLTREVHVGKDNLFDFNLE